MWVLWGCGPAEPPAPPPASPAPPPGAAVAPLVVAPEGALSLGIAFDGVSPLYRGYFSTAEWVQQLSTELGACVSGTATVRVGYDSERFLGTVVLDVEPGQLRCRPQLVDSGLDLAPLVPVGQALSRYRERVAGARDLRVSSFRTAIRVLRNTDLCGVWLGGQFPPDGSAFSSCVTHQGFETCFGDRHDGVLTMAWDALPTEVSEGFRRCFGP